MKSKKGNIPLGLALIGAGGLFLAQTLGLLDAFAPSAWTLIFLGAGFLFLAGYFTEGVSAWGWLFPATIFMGIAATIFMADRGIGDAIVAAPVIAGVGLPFLAAYLVNRKANWWALIPAWSMFVVMLILVFADYAPGEAIAALVLFGVAAPFFLVFFLSIPNWWAMIPAGILTSIGVMILLTGIEGVFSQGTFAVGVMFLGWAVTFGVLWLRRHISPTDWAKYPTIPLAIIGLGFLVFTDGVEYLGAILLILGGGYLLLRGFTQK